jgi:hypothetical protein
MAAKRRKVTQETGEGREDGGGIGAAVWSVMRET